jgi:hypothetical protein
VIFFGREVGREAGAADPAPAAQATAAAASPAEDEVLAEGEGIRITAGDLRQLVNPMKSEARRRFGTTRALLDSVVEMQLLAQEVHRRGLDGRPGNPPPSRLIKELVEQEAQAELGPRLSEAEAREARARAKSRLVARLRAQAKLRIDEDAVARTQLP